MSNSDTFGDALVIQKMYAIQQDSERLDAALVWLRDKGKSLRIESQKTKLIVATFERKVG